MQTSSHF
jgi:hypothetical protein